MMKQRPISEAQDDDIRLSQQALLRAARRAHDVALATGTRVVVSRKGVIEHLEPTHAHGMQRQG